MIETEKGKTQGPGERGRVVEGSEEKRECGGQLVRLELCDICKWHSQVL